jgi:hypothetical protein
MRQLPSSVADMQSDGRRGAELQRKSLWLEQRRTELRRTTARMLNEEDSTERVRCGPSAR